MNSKEPTRTKGSSGINRINRTTNEDYHSSYQI